MSQGAVRTALGSGVIIPLLWSFWGSRSPKPRSFPRACLPSCLLPPPLFPGSACSTLLLWFPEVFETLQKSTRGQASCSRENPKPSATLRFLAPPLTWGSPSPTREGGWSLAHRDGSLLGNILNDGQTKDSRSQCPVPTRKAWSRSPVSEGCAVSSNLHF